MTSAKITGKSDSLEHMHETMSDTALHDFLMLESIGTGRGHNLRHFKMHMKLVTYAAGVDLGTH